MTESVRRDPWQGTVCAKAQDITQHNSRDERCGCRGGRQSKEGLACQGNKFKLCPRCDGKCWWVRLKGSGHRELVRTLLPNKK